MVSLPILTTISASRASAAILSRYLSSSSAGYSSCAISSAPRAKGSARARRARQNRGGYQRYRASESVFIYSARLTSAGARKLGGRGSVRGDETQTGPPSSCRNRKDRLHDFGIRSRILLRQAFWKLSRSIFASRRILANKPTLISPS